MPARIPEALKAPITDLASAKAWIEALRAADLSFHFDDSPETVINLRSTEEDARVFHDADCPLIRERVGQLYDHEWGVFDCPIGFLLAIEAEAGTLDYWTVGDLLEYSNGQMATVCTVGEGPNRHRAILKCETGYMVAERDRESYAAGDWTDAFEERESLFPSVADAIAAAGGLGL
jgi:hypothetical protein